MKKPVQVEFLRLCKTFTDTARGKQTKAVDNFTYSVESGELLTILGPSGCGKTTVLRMLAGFENPTSGDIKVDGKGIINDPPNKRNSTMVFQSYALFPHMNVEENISFGLKLRNVDKVSLAERLKEAVKMVGLSGFEKRRPNELSGGQQQRVALARALIVEPNLLLFDEPLSNLDAKLREAMRTEISRIQKQLGITAVYVTHDQVEAMAISDKVVVMKDGRIEQAGKPWEIYLRPKSRFVADFMGAANFFSAKIEKLEEAKTVANIDGKTFEIPYVDDNASIGEQITIVARPENILVTSELGGLFDAQVSENHYLGGFREYRINSKSLGSMISREPVNIGDKIFKAGEAVGISFKNNNLHYLIEAQ